MARRLFFVPEVKRDMAELHDEMAQHLTRVLRVEPGQVFEISDNEHLYLATVEVARKSVVSFRVQQRLAPRPASYPVTLDASLFKFDHFEWMLEKATELGVGRIQPFVSERSEHGLAKAAPKRMERWSRILLEASQQCRRPRLPVLGELLDGPDAIATGEGLRIWLDERPGGQPLLELMSAERPPAVSLLLGPEGGWAEREAVQIAAAGWRPATLGPLILRAETAALAAVALVQASGSAAPGSHS
jgi:16S rRNA (uracil1498-N3)-methyltransferase